MLSPVHYRRPISRRVSYYALFKWWLLLSQHPRCLGKRTSFCTEHGLGTLADDLGCFPLDHEVYPPRSDSRDSRGGIRSLVEGGRLVAPSFHSVALPPSRSGPRLALKLFRGEPAISKFDWPFTPMHSSSPNFSTLVRSDLRFVLPNFHPGHA